MSQLLLQLRRLNSKSHEILSELNKEEPSLELLQDVMDARQHSVDELGILTDGLHKNQLPAEEAENLDQLFLNFRDLNLQIMKSLEEVLNNRREEIATVTKQQKAMKGYQLLEEPDISYFQRR